MDFSQIQEAALGPVSRIFSIVALCASIAVSGTAQSTSKVTLDSSETLFSVLAVLNACGYDRELASSHPLRAQIRADLDRATEAGEAALARQRACAFYRDKQLPDPGQNIGQYISLAVNLGPAPEFKPVLPEADLPPDAANVLGFAPLLQTFHAQAGLNSLWQKYQPQYDGLIAAHSKPVAQMLFQTDLYLRIPLSGPGLRRMVVYLDPLGAPGEVNARNYGNQYVLVLSPGGGAVRQRHLEQLRHTYLHYALDPLPNRLPMAVKRIEPLLESLDTAPMDRSYKQDVALLIVESLIRGIEARTSVTGKGDDAEKQRLAEADQSVKQGFVLARYFAEALRDFEAQAPGLEAAFGDMVRAIELGRERKRAQEVQFEAASTPDVVRIPGTRRSPQTLDLAEERLAAGDAAAARKLAQEVLDQQKEDPARALFIMGRASTLLGDMRAAQLYFERTLSVAREPQVVAWTHIYLARILDMNAQFADGTLDEDVRNAALQHYRAALSAGDTNPATKTAAEKGLQAPYAPMRR